MRKIKQNIKDKLQSLLTSKYLQEPLITLRHNRFVVPVKVEYQSEIKGFIHSGGAPAYQSVGNPSRNFGAHACCLF